MARHEIEIRRPIEDVFDTGDGLLDGGTVTMPLEKAPWGDQFGMLTDRFGVGWMVNIAGMPPQP